jgi:hypothetical protein
MPHVPQSCPPTYCTLTRVTRVCRPARNKSVEMTAPLDRDDKAHATRTGLEAADICLVQRVAILPGIQPQGWSRQVERAKRCVDRGWGLARSIFRSDLDMSLATVTTGLLGPASACGSRCGLPAVLAMPPCARNVWYRNVQTLARGERAIASSCCTQAAVPPFHLLFGPVVASGCTAEGQSKTWNEAGAMCRNASKIRKDHFLPLSFSLGVPNIGDAPSPSGQAQESA